MKVLVLFVFLVSLCYGQDVGNSTTTPEFHNGLTERIGNFSVELLYHTSKVIPKEKNLIMSPITVWTILAVTAEGASGNTLAQINNAIRTTRRTQNATRMEFRNIAQWLQVKTSTVELAKVNAMFVDQNRLPLQDFRDSAKQYDTDMVALDFSKADEAANLLNKVIENVTHGKIPKLVSPDLFSESSMVLTSALYFKGHWTLPFNASSTSKLPFYSSDNKKIGEVNMMYNRHNYPFANLQDLQARVIELPYGQENRLSMLVMVPHPGVSLESMFLNFSNVTLDKVFNELKIAKDEYGEDEVDCFLPRFKISSTIDMTPILRDRFAITDLFDSNKSRLPHVARTPLYVSRIVHKAEIEVTEVGTTATGVTAAEFTNRFGVIRFEANRPFTYMIVEKVTNSIVFGGFYQEPSLY